ncbi:MAG: hypothetical protein RLZZ519_2803 [Bacteroidota bacterium]
MLVGLGISQLWGQRQNDFWYFGNRAALGFASGSAVPVAGSNLVSVEGCATVSDPVTGALLFYSDGLSIWNANNAVMPNGSGLLAGASTSASQGVLIVPDPASNDQYYVFTVDEAFNAGANGLRYSVVNMNLDAGNGDVLPNRKNILVQANVSERLAVAPMGNGKGYWIMVHGRGNNRFSAFPLTAAGVGTVPVVSNVGLVHSAVPQANGDGTMGCLSFNNAADQLAVAIFAANKVELFDFDNCSGVVSNPLTINAVDNPYGIAFSPDDSKLYFSLAALGRVYQANLQAPNPANAVVLVGTTSSITASVGALVLAPDGKIYISVNSDPWLSTISQPNNLGNACGFVDVAVNLPPAGLFPRTPIFGLPQHVPNRVPEPWAASILGQDSCLQSGAFFSLSATPVGATVAWNFGDPGSGASNVAFGSVVQHSFTAAGSYTITAVLIQGCDTTTFDTTWTVIDCNATGIIGIKIVGDTCQVPAKLALQVEGTSTSPYFFWNFGDPASGSLDTVTITGGSVIPFPTHVFSAPGLYQVCVTFQEGQSAPQTLCETISIGLCCTGFVNSTGNCAGEPIEFDVLLQDSTVQITWQFGDPSSGAANNAIGQNVFHTFATPGNYTVTATVFEECDTFDLQSIVVVESCNSGCVASIVSRDTCFANPIGFLMVSDEPILSVDWNFGDPASGQANLATGVGTEHLFTRADTFLVEAIVEFDCGFDTVQQTVRVVDCAQTQVCNVFWGNAFTPNGDGLNDIFDATFTCVPETVGLSIFDRWGKMLFFTTDASQGWDGSFREQACPEGVYLGVLEVKFPGQPSTRTSHSVTLLR